MIDVFLKSFQSFFKALSTGRRRREHLHCVGCCVNFVLKFGTMETGPLRGLTGSDWLATGQGTRQSSCSLSFRRAPPSTSSMLQPPIAKNIFERFTFPYDLLVSRKKSIRT